MDTPGQRRVSPAVAVGIMACLAICGPLYAQSGPGGERDQVLFEDSHVRFVEVTRWPGSVQVPAEPYAAIIAVDAAWPAISAPRDWRAYGTAGHPPHNIGYPWCQTHAALPAQAMQVRGSFPQHFYRFEYKRLDGAGFSTHWREWYPWILAPVPHIADLDHQPQPGKPFSAEWPYPIIYNAITAAPANHFVRYEDAHIQLVEVTVRPEETENMHGHPYRSVYANDGAGPTDPVPVNQQNHTLHPVSAPPWGAPPGDQSGYRA